MPIVIPRFCRKYWAITYHADKVARVQIIAASPKVVCMTGATAKYFSKLPLHASYSYNPRGSVDKMLCRDMMPTYVTLLYGKPHNRSTDLGQNQRGEPRRL